MYMGKTTVDFVFLFLVFEFSMRADRVIRK